MFIGSPRLKGSDKVRLFSAVLLLIGGTGIASAQTGCSETPFLRSTNIINYTQVTAKNNEAKGRATGTRSRKDAGRTSEISARRIRPGGNARSAEARIYARQ